MARPVPDRSDRGDRPQRRPGGVERLGSSYQPDHLTTAIEEKRTLFEFNALVRPTEDLQLFLADMEGRPRSKEGRQWLEANAGFRRDILARLEQSGPLLSRDIPDTSSVPWKSMGRTHNRNVTLMLEVLMMRGEIPSPATRPASAYGIWLNGSAPVEPVPAEEAERIRNHRRLRALGIARQSTTKMPREPNDVGEVGEVAVVESTRGM